MVVGALHCIKVLVESGGGGAACGVGGTQLLLRRGIILNTVIPSPLAPAMTFVLPSPRVPSVTAATDHKRRKVNSLVVGSNFFGETRRNQSIDNKYYGIG